MMTMRYKGYNIITFSRIRNGIRGGGWGGWGGEGGKGMTSLNFAHKDSLTAMYTLKPLLFTVYTTVVYVPMYLCI